MPKSGKLRIYFITGNHDAKFKHAAGFEVGKALSELRPDWRFIGTDTGEIVLTARDGRPLRVALIHPDGGASYAISYRLQKIIEQWSGGSKPDILACGHYHKSLMLPQYRNVCGICVGTSQDQTPYMKRRGLAAHIGFWIVEAVPSKKRGELWSRYKAEFINFYQKANVAGNGRNEEMKRMGMLAVVLMLMAMFVHAADTNIVTYFPGYVSTTNGFSDAGDTGLSTGLVYACFLVSDIDRLNATQADYRSGSVADLIRAIVEEANEQAGSNTNWPSNISINKSVRTASGSDPADYQETISVESQIMDTDTGSEVKGE